MSTLLRRVSRLLPRTMSSLSSTTSSLGSIPETPKQTRKQAVADSALIDELVALSKKNPKLVKATEAQVPGCEDITVKSWKMNEFKYYDIPSPFPTLARGLFTTDIVPSTSSAAKEEVSAATPEEWADDPEVKHRIVIRGYDKFFNIGEVPWTTWEAIKAHTEAPYVLSLKSNGCIIFIAAITPKKIIVTSKHSVGIGEVNHAAVGRRWLNKYLEKKGRSEEDLAAVLWKNRWTAVAELCDDSFEEHVLPYPPHLTGLHLHGLNISTSPFITLPPSHVDAFADEWGFIRTRTTTLQSVEDVKAFTDKCAETGTWDGEAVEGFVVRTHVSSPPTERRTTKSGGVVQVRENQSPYAPHSDFFFKVKFDEPYMMYRDWREVTKMLLSTRDKNGVAAMKASALPKSKMRRRETVEYVEWVIGDIKRHPELYAEFGKGKGIIAARERFFQWKKGGGAVVSKDEAEGSGAAGRKEDVQRKAIIAPIAIPGCGKTSVALALAKLFGWGHTQSDDVQSKKKSAPIFLKNVGTLLDKHDVVIADKNNHLTQHRTQLRELARAVEPKARVIALDWSTSVKSLPPASAHRICSERIWRRGEAHQALRPDAPAATAAGNDVEAGSADVTERRGASHHEQVLWMFINQTQELQPDEVDEIVEMELTEDLERPGEPDERENEQLGMEAQLHRALDGLCPLLGLEKPSDSAIREALLYVRTYEDELASKNAALSAKSASSLTKKEKQAKNQKRTSKAKMEEAGVSGKEAKKALKAAGGGAVRYFGILPEVNLEEVVEGVLAKLGDEDNERKESLERFWRGLKEGKRVTARPHVTIVHKNELKGDVTGAEEGEDVGSKGEEVRGLKALWGRCVEVYEMSGAPLYECSVEALVWDGRTMAIVVDGLSVEGLLPSSPTSAPTPADDADLVEPLNTLSVDDHAAPSNAQKKVAKSVVDALSERRKARLHVTVGTRDAGVRPVEAGWLVRRWRDAGEKEGVFGEEGEERAWCVRLGGEKVRGVLKGLVA